MTAIMNRITADGQHGLNNNVTRDDLKAGLPRAPLWRRRLGRLKLEVSRVGARYRSLLQDRMNLVAVVEDALNDQFTRRCGAPQSEEHKNEEPGVSDAQGKNGGLT